MLNGGTRKVYNLDKADRREYQNNMMYMGLCQTLQINTEDSFSLTQSDI
jgi:hypothetical protein